MSSTSGLQKSQRQSYAAAYQETIAQARRILEINPNFPLAYDLMGMAYEQQGKYGEAAAEHQRYFDNGGGGDAKMHLAHLNAGRTAEAGKLLRDMENPPRGEFASPYDVASVYAGLGDKSRAMYGMNEAVKARAAMMPAGIDPLFDPIRTDPQFQALLHRLGLAQASEMGAQSGSNGSSN